MELQKISKGAQDSIYGSRLSSNIFSENKSVFVFLVSRVTKYWILSLSLCRRVVWRLKQQRIVFKQTMQIPAKSKRNSLLINRVLLVFELKEVYRNHRPRNWFACHIDWRIIIIILNLELKRGYEFQRYISIAAFSFTEALQLWYGEVCPYVIIYLVVRDVQGGSFICEQILDACEVLVVASGVPQLVLFTHVDMHTT